MRHRAALVTTLLGLFVATALVTGCAPKETAAAAPSPTEAPESPTVAPSATPPPPTATAAPTNAPEETPAVPEPTADPPPGRPVTILYTNDTYGYIDPCG